MAGSDLPIRDLATEYEAGTSLRELAARYQRAYSTIRTALIAAGVPMRPHGGDRTPPRPPLPMVEVVALYQAGHSIEQLAQRYGRSYGTIRTQLHACPDVQVRPPGNDGARVCEPASAYDGGRLVAVVGPPAVGKSTATGAATVALNATVVRLRELAGWCRAEHPELEHLFGTADPLGWLPDDTVRVLLGAAIGGPTGTGAGTLLLENLPGNAAQLCHLTDLAAAHGLGLHVIELVAPDDVLIARAGGRRVCQRCEPDQAGDPHRPAQGIPGLPDVCARCRGRLMPRRGDETRLLQQRLSRFRSNQPLIRAATRKLQVPHLILDATGDPVSVSHAFLAACQPFPGNHPARSIDVTLTQLPTPTVSAPHDRADRYGHARLPASAHSPTPDRIEKIPYGRFRNVYLYVTERCQLRCEHCYMGERLDRALKMPLDDVTRTLRTWRSMGGSKLTILGGEPTLHPDYIQIIRAANDVGFEQVITTSNGLEPAIRKFRQMSPADFAYIQVSLDGGRAESHDQIRGQGTFRQALRNVAELVERGFDTRIICTVNRVNAGDSLELLGIADQLGVSLVKFHVFSVIGSGHGAPEWAMPPQEWIAFYERLEQVAPDHRTRVWYQPTYARRSRISDYAQQGYRGCIGRTLDRISIFPDGRAYVCSYLFDTDLQFATMVDGQVVLNKGPNEFDLFTQVITRASCGGCKEPAGCAGGCPAEELVMGAASCAVEPDIVPVCRLWKADVPTAPPV